MAGASPDVRGAPPAADGVDGDPPGVGPPRGTPPAGAPVRPSDVVVEEPLMDGGPPSPTCAGELGEIVGALALARDVPSGSAPVRPGTRGWPAAPYGLLSP
ncbi:MAG: hypothetical protein ACRDOO_29165 [Actinomadura sp.]